MPAQTTNQYKGLELIYKRKQQQTSKSFFKGDKLKTKLQVISICFMFLDTVTDLKLLLVSLGGFFTLQVSVFLKYLVIYPKSNMTI